MIEKNKSPIILQSDTLDIKLTFYQFISIVFIWEMILLSLILEGEYKLFNISLELLSSLVMFWGVVAMFGIGLIFMIELDNRTRK